MLRCTAESDSEEVVVSSSNIDHHKPHGRCYPTRALTLSLTLTLNCLWQSMKYQNRFCDEAPLPQTRSEQQTRKEKVGLQTCPSQVSNDPAKKAKKSKHDHLKMNNSTGSNNHIRSIDRFRSMIICKIDQKVSEKVEECPERNHTTHKATLNM